MMMWRQTQSTCELPAVGVKQRVLPAARPKGGGHCMGEVVWVYRYCLGCRQLRCTTSPHLRRVVALSPAQMQEDFENKGLA